MLNKYKNTILCIIKEEELDPSLFEAKEYLENTSGYERSCFKLQFKNSPLYFVFRNADKDYHLFDYFYIRYAPSLPEITTYDEQDE
jgi:hypothetical protein